MSGEAIVEVVAYIGTVVMVCAFLVYLYYAGKD